MPCQLAWHIAARYMRFAASSWYGVNYIHYYDVVVFAQSITDTIQ